MLLLVAAWSAIAASAPPPSADLDVVVTGLRNQRGAISLCLTSAPGEQFLRCDRDPKRVTRWIEAKGAERLRFKGLAPGPYSLLVMHDENRNGRLDTALGIPREGFGFSRNPAVRFGPPRYRDVSFTIAPGQNRQEIRLRYLL